MRRVHGVVRIRFDTCGGSRQIDFRPGKITEEPNLAAIHEIGDRSDGLGVAGGEMRIPALLYLFAVPIQAAGTLSLMVSIPTLAAGAVTDRRLGGLPNSALRVGLLMGVASAIGVLIGSSLLSYADRDVIKGALGLVLLVATVHLALGRSH